ncbi:protein NATD1-like [Anopheles albimanus]|uniref:Protein NATD1 n=1 Tax=Anopheles albimanus TaxID=7167 RepID=A0A182FIT3_ANOAL|nr:protein NATD1-like [Anopheles albimanus]
MSCMLFGRVVASRLTGTRACSHAVNTEVLNDANLAQFVINLDEKNRAFLKYSIDQQRKVINFQHTFVPDAAKGKGLGKVLTKAAFQYAIDHNLKVKLECEFTQKYYKDNETKYAAYVAQ